MSASNPAVRPTPASGTRGMHSQATSELSLRADSAPPRVASGTTAVRAIAAIPIASAEHKASSSEDLAFLDRLAINHAQGALSRVVSQLLMLRDVTDLAPPPRKEATPSGREQTTEPNVKPAAITFIGATRASPKRTAKPGLCSRLSAHRRWRGQFVVASSRGAHPSRT